MKLFRKNRAVRKRSGTFSFRTSFPAISAESFLIALSVAAGIFMTWYMWNAGLMMRLTDQYAHVNFPRLMVDSITPGFSQLGFWPPLLHMLMFPFTLVHPLYESGLAAPIVLIPFLVMGTVLLYRLIVLLTRSSLLGFAGALLFLMNPYVLYYSVTPMTETLFLANLIAVAYFLTKWLMTERVHYLILTGVFISLASLARFEGFILIPLVGSILIAYFLFRKRKYEEIEAAGYILFIPALAGLLFVAAYSFVYGGNPLSFLGGWWWPEVAGFGAEFTQYNMLRSVQYTIHASFHMLGTATVLVGIASGLILLAFAIKKIHLVAPLLVLFSPFVVVAVSLFRGRPLIFLPDVPPYDAIFLNERYGLTWIAFIILASLLLFWLIYTAADRSRFRAIVHGVAALVIIVPLFAASAIHLYDTAFKEPIYLPVLLNANAPSQSQIEAAREFSVLYDHGKVLIPRAGNDPFLVEAGIPLGVYIYEGVHIFYDQTLEEPWMFARWAILYNDGAVEEQWAQEREPITVRWSDSEEFHDRYELVYENRVRKIYRIQEDAIQQLAIERGLNISQIPSINSGAPLWDPGDIYAKMRLSGE